MRSNLRQQLVALVTAYHGDVRLARTLISEMTAGEATAAAFMFAHAIVELLAEHDCPEVDEGWVAWSEHLPEELWAQVRAAARQRAESSGDLGAARMLPLAEQAAVLCVAGEVPEIIEVTAPVACDPTDRDDLLSGQLVLLYCAIEVACAGEDETVDDFLAEWGTEVATT